MHTDFAQAFKIIGALCVYVLLPYGAQGQVLLLSDSSFTRNVATDRWDLDEFRTYTYNQEGVLLQHDTWEPVSGFSTLQLLRAQMLYDSLPAERISRNTRARYSYGAAPALPLRIRIQTDEEKRYNLNNQLLEYRTLNLLEDLTLGTLEGTGARFLYDYEGGACLQERIRQICEFDASNTDDLPWTNSQRTRYSYASSDLCELQEEQLDVWDPVFEVWVPEQKIRYQYDNEDRLLLRITLNPLGDTLRVELRNYTPTGQLAVYQLTLSNGLQVRDFFTYTENGMLRSIQREERIGNTDWELLWERTYLQNSNTAIAQFRTFRDGDTNAVLTYELMADILDLTGRVVHSEYRLELYDETDLSLQLLRHLETDYTHTCPGLPAVEKEVHWLENIQFGQMQALPPGQRETYRYNVSLTCSDPVVEARIQVFPNPATDRVQIYSEHLQAGARIRLLDMTGRVVLEQEAGQDWLHELSVAGLVSGMYLVQLERAEGAALVEKLLRH